MATVPISQSSPDVEDPLEKARQLAHDLGNALEIIMQTSFLLGTLDLGENGKQWHHLLDDGVSKATSINMELGGVLRLLS